VFDALPTLAPWRAAGDPLDEVHALGRIDNRRRALVDDKGPVVTGFALLGDAALHTNPTFGRGVSLAFAHAQQVAKTAERAADDPAGFATDFHAWTRRHIDVWYPSAAQADEGKIAQMARAFRGEEAPRPPASGIGGAIAAMARDDDDLARRWSRFGHLLDPPHALFTDPALMTRLQTYMAEHPSAHVDALPRRAFEVLVAD
jgi:2-polyprenyl-6-methoxyphenol hydroxylase-like FAD-dependent oxidoreductase